MKKERIYLIKDLAILFLSVILAFFLVKTGILDEILTSTRQFSVIGSFIAGVFFSFIFTVAPSTVILGEIAKSQPVLLVAFTGGLGAMIGDLLIFRFIENRLSRDVEYIFGKARTEKLIHIFNFRFFRWLLPILGAIIIASPLPDEVGLALMGLSKIKIYLFILITFFLNAAGISVIGFIARAL